MFHELQELLGAYLMPVLIAIPLAIIVLIATFKRDDYRPPREYTPPPLPPQAPAISHLSWGTEATSEPNRVVTNGMSQYSRNERNANAGIVVGITPDDYPGGPLAGIDFQRALESKAYDLGGSNYEAPGQLVGDFLAGKASTEFGSVIPSYKPGVHLTDLADALPPYAIEAIREAIPAFEKQIKGFSMKDAVLTGIETRTSSPLRITRGSNFQSLNIKGLYPAGEGAGYAGGILSAGVDGIKVAEAVALDYLSK